MNDFAVIGIAVFTGILVGRLFDRIGLPEVIGTVLVGIFLGESVLGVLTVEKLEYYRPLIDLALALFGFFIGAELKVDKIRKIGYTIIFILLFEVLFTFILVTTGMYLYTGEILLSLLLATLAVSTAPAATADVIWEYGSSGILATTILALVGFDDVATVFIYSITSNYVINTLQGKEVSIIPALTFFLHHIGLAVIIGIICGYTLTIITRLFHRVREIYIIAIGIVILTSGLAEVLNASEIISTMILGFMFSNYCKKAGKALDTVRELTAPIFTIFFVLIGAKLKTELIPLMFMSTLVYLISSIFGKSLGSTIGAFISRADEKIKKNIGITLYSQAGIALGLGTQLYYNLKNIGEFSLAIKVINTLIPAVLILLFVGPIMIKYALYRAGEIKERG